MKTAPDGCTDLVGLRFLCPDPELGDADYQSVLTVSAEDFPVYGAAPLMLRALQHIYATWRTGGDARSRYSHEVCAALRKALATRESEGNGMTCYQVIVGNIGTVYAGSNGFTARQKYQEYKSLSMNNYGRAAGEPVTLLKEGEITAEYFGTLDQS